MRANRDKLIERDRWFATLYEDPRHRLASAEDVEASMRLSGVDRTVVLGFPWRDAGLCREHNDYLIDSVRKSGGRLLGMAIVQPLDAGDAKELERCLDAGLVGLGELGPDGQRFDLGDQHVLEAVAEVLRAYGRPLLTHASEPVGHPYHGKGETFPSKLLALARNFPDNQIVLAHWGGGLPFYELMPEVREALRNVYYDTAASTFLYDFQIFRVAALVARVQRILWGTDFPLLGQVRFLERIRALGLPDAEEAAILGGNAAALLRLAD